MPDIFSFSPLHVVLPGRARAQEAPVAHRQAGCGRNRSAGRALLSSTSSNAPNLPNLVHFVPLEFHRTWFPTLRWYRRPDRLSSRLAALSKQIPFSSRVTREHGGDQRTTVGISDSYKPSTRPVSGRKPPARLRLSRPQLRPPPARGRSALKRGPKTRNAHPEG
jgi:hypothetical protein